MCRCPYVRSTGDAPGSLRVSETLSSVFGTCLRPSQPKSDVGQLAKILVVLGKPTLTLADRLDVLDEFDRLEPLDHLEAELILDTQPQRRPVRIASLRRKTAISSEPRAKAL
jgi:hypothetical protein